MYDKIVEIARDFLAANHTENTPDTMLAALTEIRSDWLREDSVSDEKDAWINKINQIIAEHKEKHNL